MLDQETKRKIDNARDILVGKVPDPKSQVEQITIALIYKFMDDMDKESVALGGKAAFFKGDYEKYTWSRIFDPKLSGFDLITLYSEAITTMNHNENIPQLFRDIFKNAFLPYRDPETLKSFLKEINEFKYDHSEKLGDAFEYLLSVLGSQGDAGQFRTPRHIIDFIVSVVDPKKNESILDPACGTAGFLISSFKHILSQNTKERKGDCLTMDERKRLMNSLVGYDISPDMVRLSLVNMYLHGFSTPKIHEYDTLTSEEKWNETYDVILANPPFMTPKGGIRPHKRFSVQANRSEVLFVDYMMEHISTNGRVGVIVPEGIIFQSANAYKALRRLLVDNGSLFAVISLPAGVFQPYSGVKTSILLMDKSLAKKAQDILFVKIENEGFDLGAQRRAIDKNNLPGALEILLKYKKSLQEGKECEFSEEERRLAHRVAKVRIVQSGDYNLSGERYKEVTTRAKGGWEMVGLGKISERITKGTTPTTVGFKFQNNGQGINFIKIESITESGSFIPEKFALISQECHENLKRSQLKENDILFSIAGAFGRVGIVCKEVLPANTNQALSIITLKQDIDPKYVFWLLKSEDTLKLIEFLKTGVAQYNISLKQVSEIKIPLPPLSVQQEIVAEIESYQKIIDGARQVVENYKPKINVDERWEVVELGEMCKIEYGYTDSAKDKGDTRFIRITDINENGKLKEEEPKFINLSNESKPYLLKKGDLLVARTGATYGKTLFFNEKYQAVFASYLIRLNFKEEQLINEYYWIFSQSADYQKQKESLVQGGGQPQFNGNAIVRIKIPVPPLDVQKEIVARIEEEQKLVDANKKLIELFEEKIKEKIAEVWG